MIKTIKISDIIVKDRKRSLDLKKVKEIAESIKNIGLLQNIIISAENELLAGYHRLEAMKLLKNEEIEVNVVDVSELNKELIEIDENLIRKGLSVLERSEQLLRRKQIYEIIHPDTKAGVAQAKAMHKKREKQVSADSAATTITESPKSFIKDTSEKTGISERALHEDIQIAANLTPETKAAIIDTSLNDKKTKLLELARIPEKEQLVRAIAMINEVALASAEYKKNRKKLNNKDFIYGKTFDEVLEQLKTEITDNNEQAYITLSSLINGLGKKKELIKILENYKPRVLNILLNKVNLWNMTKIVELGYNPFKLPELLKEQSVNIINEIDQQKGSLNYNQDSELLKTLTKIKKLLKAEDYLEACNSIFTVEIRLKFDY